MLKTTQGIDQALTCAQHSGGIAVKRRLASYKILITWMIILLLGGCAPKVPAAQEPFVSPDPKENKVTLTLYFGNDNADGLVMEQRDLVRRGESLESLAIQELIKGPQGGGKRTIPAESKLRSVKVENGIAYVDFSKEMQSKHWGGTAGESMTVGSVVYTLTELPGIKKVQFLIEGKTEEAIWGHGMTNEPIGRGNMPIDASAAANPPPGAGPITAQVWKDRSPTLAGEVRAMATGSFSAKQTELAVAAGDRLYLYAKTSEGFKLLSEQKLERYVTALASGDLDGDGLDELIMVGASSGNWNSSVPGFISVYEWQGSNFTRTIDQSHGKVPLNAVGAMDITADGKAEILVSNDNGMWVFTMDQPAHLKQLHALSRFAGLVSTYKDASGKEYMGWTDASRVTLAVYTWEKDGFKEQWVVRGGAMWTGGPMIWGDITGDGKAELAFPNRSGGESFFDNQGKPVEIDAATTEQLREWSSGRMVMMNTQGDARDELIVGVGTQLVVLRVK